MSLRTKIVLLVVVIAVLVGILIGNTTLFEDGSWRLFNWNGCIFPWMGCSVSPLEAASAVVALFILWLIFTYRTIRNSKNDPS